MRSHSPPIYVGLPEIGEYTDRFTMDNLGLPVGFNDESLEVNIPGINQALSMSGIGRAAIIGANAYQDTAEISVSDVNSHGAATAHRSERIKRAKLYIDDGSSIDTYLENDVDGLLADYYDWRTAILRLNTSAIATRISTDGKRWQRGSLEPGAQAHYLNKALKAAIGHEAVNSYIRDRKYEMSVLACITAALNGLGSLLDGEKGAVFASAFGITSWSVLTIFGHVYRRLSDEVISGQVKLPERKWSFVPYVPLDRLLLAQLVSCSTKMIRPANPEPTKAIFV